MRLKVEVKSPLSALCALKYSRVFLFYLCSSNVDDQEDLVGKMKIIMNEDEEDETSTKKTNNKNFDASSLSILSNTHSEQSDLNIESSREENIQFDPLFLQVSICIRHENDVQIDCPISQLPTCLIDIIKFINSEDGKELGMTSHKMSLITIFGHKLFRQKFHQKFDIFHKKISTDSDFGSYLV